MRAKIIAGAAVLACALLGSGSAFAAGAPASADSLSGSVGAMTCGQFQGLSADARKDIVQQIGASAPNSALTSNSGAASSNTNSSVAVAGSPLTGGQLIAACQAATPATSLIDAYSHFNSGSNTPAANSTNQ